MTKTKTINNVVYWFRPTAPVYTCVDCVAENDHQLCVQLGDECRGGVWTKPPVQKPHTPVETALKNYDQLAGAMQAAGGAVEALQSMTLFEFLAAAAKNNITITAKYTR